MSKNRVSIIIEMSRFNRIPHGPLTIVLEFYIENDMDAVLLYQSCKKMRDLVEERVRQRQPYKRRLFYNLNLNQLRSVSRSMCDWYESQGQDPYHEKFITKACKIGDLRAIKFLRSIVLSWPDQGICCAAREGHIDVVKWLRRQGDTGRCMFHAIRGGHLDLVRWLYRTECGLTIEHFEAALESGSIWMVEWLLQNNCPSCDTAISHVASSGNVRLAEYLWNRGFKDMTGSLRITVTAGQINMYNWLKEKGCRSGEFENVIICYNGSVEALQIFIREGYWVDERLLLYSIRGERDDLAEWLIDQGIPLSSELGTVSISCCGLNLIKKILARGISLGQHAMIIAIQRGDLSLIKFLAGNGYRWHSLEITAAEKCNHREIAEWLRTNKTWEYTPGCTQS